MILFRLLCITMNRRELILQNEPNVKRQKTNGVFTTRINYSIPNMIAMPLNEHTLLEKSSLPPISILENIRFPSEHNNIKLPSCESNEKHGESTIDKLPNVYDDVGVFTPNSNTQNTEEERSDHHEREAAPLVSGQKHIDELPVELLMDTFDYLSLKDLRAIRQTSKKWRQMAGYSFQNNYSSMIAYVRSETEVHALTQFIRRIRIRGLRSFQHFLNAKPNLQQLKSITLTEIDLTGVRVDCVKKVLNNVEHLEILSCKMDEHSFDHILALTTILKRLTLCYIEIGNE